MIESKITMIMNIMLLDNWRYSPQDLKDMTDGILDGAIMYKRLALKSMLCDGPACMQKAGATMGYGKCRYRWHVLAPVFARMFW